MEDEKIIDLLWRRCETAIKLLDQKSFSLKFLIEYQYEQKSPTPSLLCFVQLS